MATVRNTLIFGAASLGLITIGPSLINGASAAADKLRQNSLQAQCNPDWGPSTQYIRGEQVKCNMAPQSNP